MRTLAALLVALPLAASAQYEPAPPYGGYAARRHPWYFSIGLGEGGGAYVWNDVTETFKDWNYDPPRQSTTGSFNVQLGATLSDFVLLGFDYTLMGVTSSDDGFTTGVWLQNADAVLTFFPQGEGFFLRGGAGLSSITFDDNRYADRQQTYRGFNALAGIGYALWLGQALNLTIGADVSGQLYAGADGPSSSRSLVIGVGLAWY